MDPLTSYLTAEIFGALTEGDRLKFFAYLAIFFVLWLEIRGLKKAVKKLGDTIGKSFADGEKRFDALEARHKDFEHRLTMLEQQKT